MTLFTFPHSRVQTAASILFAIFASQCGLSAQTAYERALRKVARLEDSRLVVDNLLIGCTTSPEGQAKVAEEYGPRGQHLHDGKVWVSYDLDPTLRPDICASVVNLEARLASIRKKVYVEHLNDVAGQPLCWTYQGELIRKLKTLMEPGALLYLDFYPRVGLYPTGEVGRLDAVGGYLDDAHSPYGVSPETQVDSADNPFWLQATIGHFAKAVQAGSAFDDFHGREAVLRELADEMRRSPGFMAGMPRLTSPEALDQYLLEAAASNLDAFLARKRLPDLAESMRVFYKLRLERRVIAFLRREGFPDAKVVSLKTNPFNGRTGEKMIVATRQ